MFWIAFSATHFQKEFFERKKKAQDQNLIQWLNFYRILQVPCLDESPLVHTYATDDSNGQPFTAYFTGGNRITFLNNNAEGRYRLEAQVTIVCSGKPHFLAVAIFLQKKVSIKALSLQMNNDSGKAK